MWLHCKQEVNIYSIQFIVAERLNIQLKLKKKFVFRFSIAKSQKKAIKFHTF